jgi:hypothetical protein
MSTRLSTETFVTPRYGHFQEVKKHPPHPAAHKPRDTTCYMFNIAPGQTCLPPGTLASDSRSTCTCLCTAVIVCHNLFILSLNIFIHVMLQLKGFRTAVTRAVANTKTGLHQDFCFSYKEWYKMSIDAHTMFNLVPTPSVCDCTLPRRWSGSTETSATCRDSKKFMWVVVRVLTLFTPLIRCRMTCIHYSTAHTPDNDCRYRI